MRKWTSPFHYIGGAVSALVTFFVGLPIGLLMVLMFTTLEVWDALKGRDSWGDMMEFVVGYFAICVLILVLAVITMICSLPSCTFC